MAIIVICKKCHGTGKEEKVILKLFKIKRKCQFCHGKGKRDVSTTNPTHYI